MNDYKIKCVYEKAEIVVTFEHHIKAINENAMRKELLQVLLHYDIKVPEILELNIYKM